MTDFNTLLDAVLEFLASTASYNESDEVAPVAILWPDEKRTWEGLLPALAERVPTLMLGKRAEGQLVGGGPWIRWMLDEGMKHSLSGPPVVYLPGIPATALGHPGEEMLDDLAVLGDLRHRGVVFTMANGGEWTPREFLRHLDVSVAPGIEADRALTRALMVLANKSVTYLREFGRWTVADLDRQIGFEPRPLEPSVEELIARGESTHLEFKSTARVPVGEKTERPRASKAIERIIAKAVASFLNSHDGGTLLIGVADDKSIVGIEADYPTWSTESDRNIDKYELWLRNDLLYQMVGFDMAHLIRTSFHTVDGRTVCKVDVLPASRPVFLPDENIRNGWLLYARVGNSSAQLKTPYDALMYGLARWGRSSAGQE
jgi:hypothetical protein